MELVDETPPVYSSPVASADSLIDALTPAFSRIVVAEESGQREPLQDTSNKIAEIAPVKKERGGRCVVLSVREGLLHDTGENHQECKARLEVLAGLEGALRGVEGTVLEEISKRCSLADMCRVHDCDYVAHMKSCCEKKFFDSDTVVTPDSYDAAVTAAGAAISAVDRAAQGEDRTFFVVARPPGHHAGPRGAVPCDEFFHRMPDMCSSGFCLLNTVAIAAAYARYRYSSPSPTMNTLEFSKIAIIDIDIHHGNGTQAIVENLLPHHVHLPLPPSWPRQTRWSYKPWLSEDDADNVFFASVHLASPDGTFYPGGGVENPSQNVINVPLAQVGPRPGDAAARRALSPASRANLVEKAGRAFRKKIQQDILPKLASFHPDIVFMSSGFDGHRDDLYYFLDDEDYSWVTTEILKAANPKAVVSVLEGGYAVSRGTTKCHSSRTSAWSDQKQRSKTRRQTTMAAACSSCIEETPSPPQDLPRLCGLASAARAHVRALAAFSPFALPAAAKIESV